MFTTTKPLAGPLAGNTTPQRVVVLMTCFNRKAFTLACLDKLAICSLPPGISLSAVLVDDGSSDGTADAVAERFSWVKVIRAEGNLYWCRGMYRAFADAQSSEPDFYLWLNDDTMLRPDALLHLFDTEQQLRAQRNKPVLVVGTTVDPGSGALSYGGERRVSRLRRSRFRRLPISDVPQQCDSMNGNIVLISREVTRLVGNVDPAFEHAMGDTDYGLRANQCGAEVWVGAGVHGECGGNAATGTYMDASLPLSRRWKQMMSRKGLPWRSWLVLTRRHMGLFWPLYFSWPYVSLVLGKYGRRGGR